MVTLLSKESSCQRCIASGNIGTVEKLQFSLFLISCSQRILNASCCPGILLLKIACLHVSFTAYENFYKQSKMHSHLVLTFHFLILRMSEYRNPIIKHISTYTLVSFIIHKHICDRSLSGDPFHIVNPFLRAKGLSKCDSTHIPN